MLHLKFLREHLRAVQDLSTVIDLHAVQAAIIDPEKRPMGAIPEDMGFIRQVQFDLIKDVLPANQAIGREARQLKPGAIIASTEEEDGDIARRVHRQRHGFSNAGISEQQAAAPIGCAHPEAGGLR